MGAVLARKPVYGVWNRNHWLARNAQIVSPFLATGGKAVRNFADTLGGEQTAGGRIVRGKGASGILSVAEFDGADDVIDYPNGSTLVVRYVPTPLTVCIVMRCLTPPANFDGVAGASNSNQWTEGWGMFCTGGTGLRFFVQGWETNFSDVTVGAMTDWNVFVGVWNKNQVILYGNGVPGAADTYAGALSSTHLTRIGILGTYGQRADMHVADFRIYNRPWTESEVRAYTRNPWADFQPYSPFSGLFLNVPPAQSPVKQPTWVELMNSGRTSLALLHSGATVAELSHTGRTKVEVLS